ncbi:lipoprotein [Desulfosarcina widdelii]|uniref:Lipoprotein n=2 Tax=Desulfosarcina widdelii TaxID=947919 RepID=A0A5K7YWU7_9BACT|nr:lipoprotein [Desulfosarcina widdelii]
MIKKRALIFFAVVVIVMIGAIGQTQAGSSKTKFTLGCMPLNLPTVELIKEFLIPPYEMEIVVFDANHLPAMALINGEIDSLILNHNVWIDTFNEQKHTNLTMVKPYFYHSIFGIYSLACKDISELPQAGIIAIPGDPSNMDKALRLMNTSGLIQLGKKSGAFYSLLDVDANPKNFKFHEMEVTATIRAIRDCSAILSYSSQLKQAGFIPEKFRIYEDPDHYDTGIVVMPESEDAAWVKAVVETVGLESFKKRFNDFWQGAYVLVNP